MTTGHVRLGLGAAMAAAVMAAAVGAPPRAAAAQVAVTVQAAPGQERAVAARLGASALRVQRRQGARLQVTVAPRRIAGLRSIPGVAAADVAPAAFADEGPVTSQGLFRTGAAALSADSKGGQGLLIAVLDLGFGGGIDTRRAAGELPPADRTEVVSFDTVNGIAGRNAYGNATNHGELVAQTVYDYAPAANYMFVNYRTTADFIAAVDMLVQRRPDIVVHSNNFLEGPFDGTGAAARAVDRAAAAGTLWFNSTGNYAQRHWAGPWSDADADGALDWGGAENGLFFQAASRPITFAVSWSRRTGGPVTDLDIALQRRNDDGSWSDVATSTDSQVAGADPSERIVGYLSPVDGYFRLRVTRTAGPPPEGDITVFSREIDVPLVMGGSPAGSVPTPADAAGAIAVAAVDWRGDRLKSYSSHGPTADGRMKPDLAAPTDTALAGPAGPRGVGGTSNAAPNAAGAAALLLSSLRAQGLTVTATDIRDRLTRDALDLGGPGPDLEYGAGRVRVELTGPELSALQPVPDTTVRGVITVAARATDPSRVARLVLREGDRELGRVAARETLGTRLDTTTRPDGPLGLSAETQDWAGNVTRRDWTVTVDNTGPVVRVLRAEIARPTRGQQADTPRPAFAVLRLRDADPRPLLVRIVIDGTRTRTRRLVAGNLVLVPLGRLTPGRLALRVDATDGAGNVGSTRATRALRPLRPVVGAAR